MENKIKCGAPNHSFFITPQGYITPCCVMGDNSKVCYGHINDDSIENILNSETAKQFRRDYNNGEYNDACIKCAERNPFQAEYTSSIADRSRKYPTEDNTINLAHADITLGNVCGLSCVMCNENFSHTWSKIKGLPSFVVSKEKMIELVDFVNGFRPVELQIKGGEPFDLPYNHDFLQRLSPYNHFGVTTNGINIDDRHIEILKQRNSPIGAGLSIEATGELYKYIRGGDVEWTVPVDNICRLYNEGVIDGLLLSTTISLYNFNSYYDDIVEINKRVKQKTGSDIHHIHLQDVSYPSDQSLHLVQLELRQQLVEKLRSFPIQITFGVNALLADGNVDTSFHSVKQGIDYHNERRGINLYDVNPSVLDIIDHNKFRHK